MQVKVITLAIPALAMLAFAQTQDPNQSQQQQDTSGQQTMGTESQQGTRTETQSGTTTTRPPRQARTETSKAHTYKGTLVDGDCAMAKAGMPGQAPSAERTTEESKTGTMGTTGTAARVDTKAITQSCPVTSTTKDFALVLNDGRLVKLNQEGDAKVASELKTNDKWNKAINSNKRITASVKGVLQGDTLQVESVK